MVALSNDESAFDLKRIRRMMEMPAIGTVTKQ
jgi:hypothetical protein